MLGSLIIWLANLYSLIILIYCVFSWIPMRRRGVLADINNLLAKLCDPFLNLFRRFIPPIGGMVDITPIIAMIVLELVVRLLVALL